MSKQELKDEYKQTEGDPMVKSRIRAIQREMAQAKDDGGGPQGGRGHHQPRHTWPWPCATRAKMKAPKVVAKGADRIALKNQRVGQRQRGACGGEPTLAQNLYKLELGEEIPAGFIRR